MAGTSLNPLERSVLATLAYFDVFDYPLRPEELWRWLYVTNRHDWEAIRRATPADVDHALQGPSLAATIDRAGDFLTLRGRSPIIATRLERHVGNERKWRRAVLVARLLRFVPFVELVGVVNTLALDNARPESDIDVFIVSRRGRLWLTRLLATAVVHALGIRRHGTLVTDRACLSFYVSDRALDLEPLRVSGLQEDVYLTFWTAQVVPLFDRDGCWPAFIHANRWVVDRLPHGFLGTPTPRLGDAFVARLCRTVPELLLSTPLGTAANWLAMRAQLLIMRGKPWSRRKAGTTDVVVTDEVLKFHENDRRLEYAEAFHARLGSLLSSV